MQCSACGSELVPGAKYCGDCSAPVLSPPEAPPPRPASPAPLPSGNDPLRVEEVKNLGWNWGGFLLPYLWLTGHGRLTTGLLLMLSTAIPFVFFLHFIIYPATAVYLGLNGFENSWRFKPYHSVQQLRESEREWAIWGVVCTVVLLLGVVFFMVYLRAVVEEVWREMDTLGW